MKVRWVINLAVLIPVAATTSLAGTEPRCIPIERQLSQDSANKSSHNLATGYEGHITVSKSNDYSATPDGATVQYMDFDGNVVTRRLFKGIHAALLVRPEKVEMFGIDDIRLQIGRWDRMYAHYADLLGAEPGGDGLLLIAESDSGTAGVGFVGGKGMEVSHFVFEDHLKGPPHDILYEVVQHEMAHNFDLQGGEIFAGPDTAHSWTTFAQQYLSVYGREGQSDETIIPADDYIRVVVDRHFSTYLDYPNRSWARCVAQRNCGDDQVAVQSQGALILRFAQLYGPAVTRQWYRQVLRLVNERNLHTTNMSIEERNDLLVETLSLAAGHDLSCYIDAIQWHVSDGLRGRLGQMPSSPYCQDGDGDGVSAFLGDLTDSNAAVFPGAEEIPDGMDNDLNGAVDEITLTNADLPNPLWQGLPVELPFRFVGTIEHSDTGRHEHHFTLNLERSTHAVAKLWSRDKFFGFVRLHNGGEHSFWAQSADPRAGGFLFAPLVPGSWDISPQYNGEEADAEYEMVVYESEVPRRDERLAGVTPEAVQSGWRLHAPYIPEDTITMTAPRVRFWVDRMGWVGSVPLADSDAVSFDWQPPAPKELADHHYVYQIFDGDTPARPASRAAFFDDQVFPAFSASGVVNAASYRKFFLAPGAWVAVFGSGFADAQHVAGDGELPFELGGVEVRVLDGDGMSHSAKLSVVAPNQLNLLVPESVPKLFGSASIMVYRDGSRFSVGNLPLEHVAPGLFAINGTGQGAAAAFAILVAPDGTQSTQPVFDCAGGAECTPALVSMGTGSDDLYLALYATGIRNRSALEAVRVKLDDESIPVLFADPQGEFEGLDQINAGPVPRRFIGRRDVGISVQVDDWFSNTVTISFQ